MTPVPLGAAVAGSHQPLVPPGRAVEAVLFDRDGTLVVDVPYNGDPRKVEAVPGAVEALARLRDAGLPLGVVSNQSGVARGWLTAEQVDAVDLRVDELLGPFDTFLVCPHGPSDGCGCRKPRPGMVVDAAALLGVRPERCALVGDIGADVEAALAAGARPVLVPTPATAGGDGGRRRRGPAVPGHGHVAGRGRPRRAAGREEAVQVASAFVAAGGAAGFSDVDLPPAVDGDVPLDAVALAARVRSDGGTVVATGGCFDLLHAGHVHMLAAARSLGDCLLVCLNSDESVRRLKGPDGPLQSQDDRAAVLAALDCIDAVLVFDEDTPAEALERLQPHLFAKGADYAIADLPEARTLVRWGGEAVVLPYLQGRSTSRLMEEAVRRAP